MLVTRTLRTLSVRASTSTARLALTYSRRYSSASSSPPEIRINGARLQSSVEELASLSAPKPLNHSYPLLSHASVGVNPRSYPPPTGTSLLPPTTSLRHYLTTTLGVAPLVDDLGSIFLPLSSSPRPLAPAIAIGGPLDSSPLPLLAALEVVRTLQDHAVETTHPITLIGWSCSSGTRFPRALLGSSVWAGHVGVDEAWGIREVGSDHAGRRTVKACLREAGWLGSLDASVQLGAYFEAAPTKWIDEVEVGTGAKAWRWIQVAIKGGDALAAAAKCVLAGREVGNALNGRVSTGVFEVASAGFAGTPREATFSLYIMGKNVDEMQGEAMRTFVRIAFEEGAVVEDVEVVMDEPELKFDEHCITAIRDSLDDAVGGGLLGDHETGLLDAGIDVGGIGEGGPVKESLVERPMDAANTARRGVPTGVVMVPEDNGAEEWWGGFSPVAREWMLTERAGPSERRYCWAPCWSGTACRGRRGTSPSAGF